MSDDKPQYIIEKKEEVLEFFKLIEEVYDKLPYNMQIYVSWQLMDLKMNLGLYSLNHLNGDDTPLFKLGTEFLEGLKDDEM